MTSAPFIFKREKRKSKEESETTNGKHEKEKEKLMPQNVDLGLSCQKINITDLYAFIVLLLQEYSSVISTK